MLFTNVVPSVVLLASQIASVAANPLPEEDVAVRRSFYNDATSGLLKRHFEHQKRWEEENAALEKRGLDWNPERYWAESSGGFGFQRYSRSKGCSEAPYGRKWYYGWLVRMVSFIDSKGVRDYYRYWNETDYLGATIGSKEKSCNRYGAPVYDPGTQCVDGILNPSTGKYVPRDKKNNDMGWFSNDPAYGKKTVRKIFDCLLNRTAVEYKSIHPDIGFETVQYELENEKYYRFYDENDFAWFAVCPKGYGMTKRQSKEKLNYNPIWDFYPPKYRNPLADKTEIAKYEGSREVKDADGERYAVYYFPPKKNHYITINGEVCGQIACSRPGLRHWTVRMYYTFDPGYVQRSEEYVPKPEEYAEDGDY